MVKVMLNVPFRNNRRAEPLNTATQPGGGQRVSEFWSRTWQNGCSLPGVAGALLPLALLVSPDLAVVQGDDQLQDADEHGQLLVGDGQLQALHHSLDLKGRNGDDRRRKNCSIMCFRHELSYMPATSGGLPHNGNRNVQ